LALLVLTLLVLTLLVLTLLVLTLLVLTLLVLTLLVLTLRRIFFHQRQIGRHKRPLFIAHITWITLACHAMSL